MEVSPSLKRGRDPHHHDGSVIAYKDTVEETWLGLQNYNVVIDSIIENLPYEQQYGIDDEGRRDLFRRWFLKRIRSLPDKGQYAEEKWFLREEYNNMIRDEGLEKAAEDNKMMNEMFAEGRLLPKDRIAWKRHTEKELNMNANDELDYGEVLQNPWRNRSDMPFVQPEKRATLYSNSNLRREQGPSNKRSYDEYMHDPRGS